MHKPAHWSFLVVFLTLALLACSKGGTSTDDGSGGGGPHVQADDDTTKPVLTILTPVNNQTYTNGSSISVTGTITDDLGLYRGSIRITNDITGEILKEQLYEIHGVKNFNFSVTAPATVTAPTGFTVSVFYEDHGLNSISQTLKVTVNP
jgi:hypothetical protein